MAALVFSAAGAMAQDAARPADQAQGQAIVTVLGKHAESAPAIGQQDIKVQLNGKYGDVVSWTPLRGQPVELVFLIDNSARTSLAREFQELGQFLTSLPPNVSAGIAYMVNGTASFGGPITADHQQLVRQLHIPAGVPGENASPYFCLSDLAKRWPSNDRNARREVVMITNGVDNYDRRYDPDDPYVQSAIRDSVRAGLVVYSIYWADSGLANRTGYANNTGQNLLTQVSESTGGINFWQGMGSPVSIQPFLDDLKRRIENQYELGFAAANGTKPGVDTMKLKISAPDINVSAPQQVVVAPGGVAER